MADEQQFIEDGLQRSQIDEFFADELGRAGYGGMDIAHTPMGTQIVLKAEKPGMVIGKGGKNIRAITSTLEERFDLEDPQVDVQEVDEPDLNARIVADRLANALERGWYFRKAGHTTVDRIMEAGALGAEIVLAGKVTGQRSRVEKFTRGYIKHNGEPAEDIVDEGQGVALVKLGTIGVTVRIIPPDADLPDDFEVHEDADVSDLVVGDGEAGVEELLEGEPDEGDVEAAAEDFDEVETPGGEPEDLPEEEVVEAPEAVEAEEDGDAAAADETEAAEGAADADDESAADAGDPAEATDDEDADGEAPDEAAEAEAEAIMAEMEADEEVDAEDADDAATDEASDPDDETQDGESAEDGTDGGESA